MSAQQLRHELAQETRKATAHFRATGTLDVQSERRIDWLTERLERAEQD